MFTEKLGFSMSTLTLNVLLFVLSLFFILATVRTENDLGESILTKLKPKRNTEKFFRLTHKKLSSLNIFEEEIIDKCTSNLLEKIIYKTGNVYLFLSNDGKKDWTKKLTEFEFSFFTEPLREINLQQSSYFQHLLIFNNKFSLKKVLEDTKPGATTKFLLMVHSLEEAMERFQDFWENRLTNVLAFYESNGSINYLTYFPYYWTHCGEVGEPVLMAKCKAYNGWFDRVIGIENLFPDKANNLFECPINITFFRKMPSSYYLTSETITGWEIELMNEIIKRMNGVPTYSLVDSLDKLYQDSKGYSSLVVSNK